MSMTPLAAILRKDLQMFFSDPRAVIMTFAVPIAIASFFGAIFSGASDGSAAARIPIAVVDRDGGAVAAAAIANARADRNLTVALLSEDEARDQVRRGKMTIGVIVPAGFGDAAARAFLNSGERPQLQLLYDPSHRVELAMVRGLLTEHVMAAVSKEAFGGAAGRQAIDDALARLDRTGMPADRQRMLRDMLTSIRAFYGASGSDAAGSAPGLTMPYRVREEAVTARPLAGYNAYAHSFAGMGIQFLLFAAASLGVEVLLERQRGLWRRLRSAPISKVSLLAGKAASMTIVSLMSLLVSFGFAMVVFRVRIQGSVVGFLAVSVATALMAAAFGLLIAALGRTPAATRGVTTFAVLIMVMLGGAWVPTFIFPSWLQQLTLVVPARWAVDGLDAMTWRGIGLEGAIAPTAVMVGFALVFWTVAVRKFRWDEG